MTAEKRAQLVKKLLGSCIGDDIDDLALTAACGAMAEIILDAQGEAEESMRKRCADAMLIMPNGMMPPHSRLGAAEARQIILCLVPSIYSEAAQP